MGRPKNKTVAIICAWREGEDDLQATIESAQKSIGKNATVYTVEDKTCEGPAKTRHRGITLSNEDIIIIIDAHMRFKDDALKVMAKHAEKNGLCCAITHHNEKCEFTKEGLYYGARFAYKVKEGQNYSCLIGKWSEAKKAGPVTCVMGGAYAFTREWYMKVGQPLAMLPGWGGDEEALSVASWMSGQMPHCVDAHIAHRYRPRPPWVVTEAEKLNARNSRLAIIHAVVPYDSKKRDLIEWQKKNYAHDEPYMPSSECLRFQRALLSLPRKYDKWLKEVCNTEYMDIEQPKQPERKPNIVIHVNGITCPACKLTLDKFPVKDTHEYPNGNISRLHGCPSCCHAFRTLYVHKKAENKV